MCCRCRRALPGDAAAFAFTYGTSHHALMDRAQLKAGETVLVLGAAGGVGTAAMQIAKAAGAKRDRRRLQRREVRAVPRRSAPTRRSTTDAEPARALKALTGGKGPDVVYDPVGGDLAEPAFRSIAWRGRYLVVGFAGAASRRCPGTWPCSRAPAWWACSGATSCARTQGQRRGPGAAGAVVRRGPCQARDRLPLPMTELPAAYRAHGHAPGDRQSWLMNRS
jgi:NADPH:quinone reductase